MKFKPWTLGLAAAGVVSLASVAQAEEAPSQILTALSSTTLSGYIDTTAIWKFGSGNANMPGRTYDGADVQDGFNLNVVSLTLAKPLDEGEWSAGYNVQLLFGPGASKRGTGSIIGGGSDVAFNEAVILLRAPVGNGIDFKVGQFGTYNGYEAYDTYKNPNWSRSYGFFIESSAHTGVSASYKFSDYVSLNLGVGNIAGYNNRVDARSTSESDKAYLAMLTLTAPESMGFLEGATLSLGYTGGDNGPAGNRVSNRNGVAGNWNQENWYLGASIPMPIENLSLGLAFDYTEGQVAKNDDAYAFAVYAVYKATDKLTFNNRFDLAWSDPGLFDGIGAGVAGADDDKLFSYTLTVDYALWQNVMSRLEFRWDHSSDDKAFGSNTVGAPDDKNAVSLALNLIYKF